MLHHSPSENTVFGRIFYTFHPKIARPRPGIAKKRGGSPSDFRDFSDFGHNCPAVAFDELRNAAAETRRGGSLIPAYRRKFRLDDVHRSAVADEGDGAFCSPIDDAVHFGGFKNVRQDVIVSRIAVSLGIIAVGLPFAAGEPPVNPWQLNFRLGGGKLKAMGQIHSNGLLEQRHQADIAADQRQEQYCRNNPDDSHLHFKLILEFSGRFRSTEPPENRRGA